MNSRMNDPEEIFELARQWKAPLNKLFKRYTPIVIGFGDTGGGGGSLKRFLEGLKSLPGGIYWCYVEESPGVPPSKEVESIVKRLNGCLVPIKGFDEIMQDIRAILH